MPVGGRMQTSSCNGRVIRAEHHIAVGAGPSNGCRISCRSWVFWRVHGLKGDACGRRSRFRSQLGHHMFHRFCNLRRGMATVYDLNKKYQEIR